MEDDYFVTITEIQDGNLSDGPTVIFMFLIVAILCLFPQIAIRR